jgi:hypothetical protein
LLSKCHAVGLLTYRIGIWAAIEVCWNIYPPRPEASLTLFTCHVLLVASALFLTKYPASPYLKEKVVQHTQQQKK